MKDKFLKNIKMIASLKKNSITQLISTNLGRLVLGSFTLQKPYMTLEELRSSANSVIPPSRMTNKKEMC
jgi:hypothetical protein